MDTAELLSRLRERDVRLWIEEERLRCSAPAGALDDEMRAALATRKQEILAFLRKAEALKKGPPAIVPIKPEGDRPPLFAVPGHNGDVFCYVALARYLAADQPLLGVQPPGLDGSEPLASVEALARYEVEQIRLYRPQGPYLLAGYCAGGTIAFEIAQQLTAAGQEVALLALIGSPYPPMFRRGPQLRLSLKKDLPQRLGRHLKVLTSGSLSERLRYVAAEVERRVHPRTPEAPPGVDPALLAVRRRVGEVTLAAIRRYRPRRYAGQIDLFVLSEAWRPLGGLPHQWKAVAGTMREHVSREESDLDDVLLEPRVSVLAASLQARLTEMRPKLGPW